MYGYVAIAKVDATGAFKGDLAYKIQSSVFVTLNNQTTGIVEFNSIEIDMYPNPASNQVTVRFSEFPAMGTQIVLTDLSEDKL